MAASKTQGTYLTGFMVAFTLLGFGFAHGGSALGKILLLLGALGMAETLLAFRSLQRREAAHRPSIAEGGMAVEAGRGRR